MSYRRCLPASLALLSVMAACGSTKHEFGAPDPNSGASGSSTGGDQGTAGGDASSGGHSAGKAGSSSGKSGTANGGGGSTSGGDTGTSSAGDDSGGTTGGGDNGGTTGGSTTGGGGGAPACGVPGAECCVGKVCTATGASCKIASCACNAGLTQCTNSCVDTTADPKNCGSCGHSCLGGVCELGSCQPVSVATGQTRIKRLATDGSYLYWSGANAAGTVSYISQRRIDGSDAVKVLAPAEAGGSAIAVAPGRIFWIAAGRLRTCDAPNCAAGPSDYIPTPTATSCTDIRYTAAKNSLYWSCSANYNAKDGSLWSLPLGTVNPTQVVASPANPGALDSDATNLYWLSSSTYTADSQNKDGATARIRLSDGTKTALASGFQGDLGSFAVGGSALYYAGNIGNVALADHNAIFTVPLPNGLGAAAPPKFASASTISTNIYAMVADAQYLYYLEVSGTTSVKRCPHSGCAAPQTLATTDNESTAITQDAVSIYWPGGSFNSGPVTLWRLAK